MAIIIAPYVSFMQGRIKGKMEIGGVAKLTTRRALSTAGWALPNVDLPSTGGGGGGSGGGDIPMYAGILEYSYMPSADGTLSVTFFSQDGSNVLHMEPLISVFSGTLASGSFPYYDTVSPAGYTVSYSFTEGGEGGGGGGTDPMDPDPMDPPPDGGGGGGMPPGGGDMGGF